MIHASLGFLVLEIEELLFDFVGVDSLGSPIDGTIFGFETFAFGLEIAFTLDRGPEDSSAFMLCPSLVPSTSIVPGKASRSNFSSLVP